MLGDGSVVCLIGEVWRLCDLFSGGSFFSMPFVTETLSRHPIILSSNDFQGSDEDCSCHKCLTCGWICGDLEVLLLFPSMDWRRPPCRYFTMQPTTTQLPTLAHHRRQLDFQHLVLVHINKCAVGHTIMILLLPRIAHSW